MIQTGTIVMDHLFSGGGVGRLTEDDSWVHPYYQPGSWRERQRKAFAGT